VPTLTALLAESPTTSPGVLAARFHRTAAEVTVALAERAAARSGLRVVCLGGGVFQNRRLTEAVLRGLAGAGFEAHVGRRVPVNDGGISYGQAAVAAALLAGR
jgi:hydrogenase maturation protein HypF